MQLTAEVADGWLPIFFCPSKAEDVWGDDLAAGDAARSADLGPLEIAAGGLVAIGDDVEGLSATSCVRWSPLYVGGMGARGKNFYNTLFSRYGYEDEAKQIQDLYLDGKKDEAAAAVPAGVPRGHLARAAPRATSRSASPRSARPASPS